MRLNAVSPHFGLISQQRPSGTVWKDYGLVACDSGKTLFLSGSDWDTVRPMLETQELYPPNHSSRGGKVSTPDPQQVGALNRRINAFLDKIRHAN